MLNATAHLRENVRVTPTTDGEFRWISIRQDSDVLSLIFGGVDAETIETCDKLIAALEAVKESLPTPSRQ